MKKMQDQSNIQISKYPSKHWEKFFNKFDEINYVPIKQWGNNHFIAFFCKKYKDYYNIDYEFRFNSSAPSKSYEVFQINKIASMLSTNPEILKDYIEWFWTTQIIAKKKRITSMSFMTDINTVNAYKKEFILAPNTAIDRTTKLSTSIIEIANKFGETIITYGDLAFMKQCIDAGTAGENHKHILQEIINNGFDISTLSKVK
jgi:hypothetical protein